MIYSEYNNSILSLSGIREITKYHQETELGIEFEYENGDYIRWTFPSESIRDQSLKDIAQTICETLLWDTNKHLN